MKKSEILRGVREVFLDGEDRGYVCIEIDAFAMSTEGEAADELIAWINGLLGCGEYGTRTYAGWLRDFHPDFFHRGVHNSYYREGRIAWLDWMIKYWEGQGE